MIGPRLSQLQPSSYFSALSVLETCIESVVDGCITTTSVTACFCSSISNYLSSAIDCFSSANFIGGTILSQLYTGAYGTDYLSMISDECSHLYTVTPFSVTSNPGYTTSHATATPTPIFEPITISV